ncbi:response regulator [Salininema proteolyticum]|uniref:Response regulator n=1 Tax=Salininema proteolyticum TaxID=1607685 RepID=A0ABV8TUU0_9ACTN
MDLLAAVIGEDALVRGALADGLRAKGYGAVEAGAAEPARALDERPDIVVLVLGSSDFESLEAVARLRSAVDVPLVVATARAEEAFIVTALELGADDYVVKPYSMGQLDARLRAILRRSRRRAV